MEFESYADVIDSFERDDMGYTSLTDYINGENIKIKEIEMDVMGDLKKALSSKKDGGLMVAIERFNQGGMAGNKTYHQYHDQYVPMDEESMMYANGGGVGSMMQPKKERVSFRGGGMDAGNQSNQDQSAAMGGGNTNNNTGGGGETNRPNPHTDSGYSKTSTVSGDRMRSSARDFVQTLNNNNAIAANQAGTKFTPYGGGSRPQGGIFSNMSFNPLAMLAGIFGGPLAGLLTRGIMTGKNKIGDLFGNFNKTMRGTNPDGTTRTQAEYEQARYDRQQTNRLDKLFAAKDRGYNQIGFGDFTKKTMDFTPGQQAKIDGLLAQGYKPSTARNVLTGRDLNLRGTLNEMPAVNIQGLNNNDYEGEIGAMNNNDFVGLNTNATDIQNYMTDQANFTQPGITPTNLNDFEGIRSIPQLNNNDYQLGTPQLNNNDFIGLNQPGITPTNLNDFIGVNQPQELSMMEQYYNDIDNRATGPNIVQDASTLAQQAKTFNTIDALNSLGNTTEKGFFGTGLTDQGKALEAFRNSATNFKNAPANTNNTAQSALNFMGNKPGLYGDVIENKDFIQNAINQGFLQTEEDYKNQKSLEDFI